MLNASIDTIAPGAQALSQLASGSVVTPRMEMMFEGVGRRNFQYTFAFLPKSVQEAKLVEDIIYHFKFYAKKPGPDRVKKGNFKQPANSCLEID